MLGASSWSNDCFKHLGKVKSLALPFFHAFSGCDSTAFFYKKSKMSLYTSWVKSQCCDEITEAFKQLSWLPTEKEIDKNLPVICKFISTAFGDTTNSGSLNEFRLKLFKASSSNNFRELPPSEEGLELHIRRSCYQSGWVWGNSTSQEPVPPVERFGWTASEDKLSILLYNGRNHQDNHVWKNLLRHAAANLPVVYKAKNVNLVFVEKLDCHV